jgi:RND family efflux transporter MFP subunit
MTHRTFSFVVPALCGLALLVVACGGPPPATPKASAPAAAEAPERKVLFYRNPMDPSITSPVPAKDEMGMDYVPVYADEAAPEASPVEGFASVAIGKQGLRLAGVQTATAQRDTISRSIRTIGFVTADETRIRHVHTKISGWIEKLSINYTGQQVRAGQPILTIYSPQLLASQEEFLRAREAAARFSASSLPEVRQGGEDLVAAARRRLELFDVPRSLLAELERTGKPRRTVALLAPVSGYVTAKEAFEGQEVQPGMELFTITDLSRIWVEAEFYEYEARLLRVGQTATVFLPYDPHVRRQGKLTFIHPTLDEESRTLKVRLEFANQDLAFKPGMFADVVTDLGTREGIVVPDSAVIDTGTRELVFVERQGGVFEPREVRVATRSNGQALILDGLAENERVVVRANFLVDSESRLRAAIAAMQSAGARQHNGGDE